MKDGFDLPPFAFRFVRRKFVEHFRSNCVALGIVLQRSAEKSASFLIAFAVKVIIVDLKSIPIKP
jgi:hypothetical protein